MCWLCIIIIIIIANMCYCVLAFWMLWISNICVCVVCTHFVFLATMIYANILFVSYLYYILWYSYHHHQRSLLSSMVSLLALVCIYNLHIYIIYSYILLFLIIMLSIYVIFYFNLYRYRYYYYHCHCNCWLFLLFEEIGERECQEKQRCARHPHTHTHIHITPHIFSTRMDENIDDTKFARMKDVLNVKEMFYPKSRQTRKKSWICELNWV